MVNVKLTYWPTTKVQLDKAQPINELKALSTSPVDIGKQELPAITNMDIFDWRIYIELDEKTHKCKI